jgi:hypothetical protein
MALVLKQRERSMSESQEETARYLASLSVEMARLAEAGDLETLTYLFRMATLEANNIVAAMASKAA